MSAPSMGRPPLDDAPRIGLGIDVHRLERGRRCVLGGLELPGELGPSGHSDGDAILHAVCDACLGAAGLDDLGTLFSDKDPRNLGRDSREFCVETMRRLGDAKLRVISLDVVVECERPKIAPHRAALRASLAELFAIDSSRVNVKGKTAEGLDAIGRGEALRVTAVALLLPAAR